MVQSIYAQSSDTVHLFHPPYNSINCLLNHSKKLGQSVYNWKSREWITFGSFAAAGLLMYYYADPQIFNMNGDISNSYSKKISPIFEFSSRAYIPVFLYTGFFASGKLFNIEYHCQTAFIGLEAFIISGSVTSMAKILTGRERPYVNNNSKKWHGPHFKVPDYTSFFSGHATVAFSMATVVSERYKKVRYLPWVCYSVATLSSLSRVHDQKHWLSDVFTGAAVGYFISKYMVKLNEKRVYITAYYEYNYQYLTYNQGIKITRCF